MLDPKRIAEIVTQAVEASIAPNGVRRVVTEPSTTSEGEEALRITIVLTREAAGRLASGHPLDVLVQIWDQLHDGGDERFPILEYATEEELEEIGDSES